MKIISGVYQIKNLKNNKQYIGCSKNIYQRWKQHTQSLPTEPPISLIQKAFNKYKLREQISQSGIYKNFEFKILEECNESNLFRREDYWLKKIQPAYNIASLPPHKDITPLHPKAENKVIVQYHNYDIADHLPGLPETRQERKDTQMTDCSHFISTKKRMAINSKGDTILMILGIKTDQGVEYFLWSKTIVEEVYFFDDSDLPINVCGSQQFYETPHYLNELEGFTDFKKKCGNFAYSFQSVINNKFTPILLAISKTDILDENTKKDITCDHYYNLFFFGNFPEDFIDEVERESQLDLIFALREKGYKFKTQDVLESTNLTKEEL